MTSLRANMFFVALGLSLLGLVMVYSATYREFGAEYLVIRGGHVLAGVLVFFAVIRVRYTSWRKFTPWIYFGVLAALLLVLVPGIGQEVGGARRWFDFGFISLQPAEFAKIAAVLTLSVALARVPPDSGIPVRPLVAVGALFGLVLVEPDFGTAVVLLAGVAGALWASEVRTRDLVLCGVAGFFALFVVMLVEPYRRQRFMTFLDPWANADGPGYQVVQSMVAIKAGDFFGSGAGGGGQSSFVPEIQTDMIFALIGEELGLAGMMVVIGSFAFLAVAGFRISLHAPTVMGRCLAAGLTTMLCVQAVFNMGAVMVVLPLAGITLPFISYGGSSLLACFAMVGILYRISEDSERAREAKPKRRSNASEDNDSRRRDGGTRDPRPLRGRPPA
jgi:cell division protein FtsW